MGAGGGHINVFLRSYKAYSPAFFGRGDLNKGNKSMFILMSLMSPVFSHPAFVGVARAGAPQHLLPHDVHAEQPPDGQENILWSARIFLGRGPLLSTNLGKTI